MDSSPPPSQDSSTSSFEVLSAHLNDLQIAHDVQARWVRHLEERLRGLFRLCSCFLGRFAGRAGVNQH